LTFDKRHVLCRFATYRVFTRSSKRPANVKQTFSKRPALARVFWIHLLEVCWTFAGSCKHPITGRWRKISADRK